MLVKETSIQYIKGVGPQKKKLFNKLGINTIEDLLYYFPKRYEDRSKFASIQNLKIGEFQTVKGTVLAKGVRKSWKTKLLIFNLVVGDAQGKIYCSWFNQPYLNRYFKIGDEVILYGKVEVFSHKLSLNSPEYEIIREKKIDSLSIGRIVPIYPLTKGISQRYFRKIVNFILKEFITKITDTLSYEIRNRCSLLNLAKSLINIHFPDSLDLQKQAYNRLCFEEFFLYQIPIILRKITIKQKQGIAHRLDEALLKAFIDTLPFQLTHAQLRVVEEIKQDMVSSKPMQRLLQGDVASGKTVVSILSCLIALGAGYQAAFMVPTEVLASQHYKNIKYQVHKIKNIGKEIKVALLTSSLDNKQKQTIYKKLKNGQIDLVIGTHSLIQEDLQFKNLSLIVIDEQHKFGVAQRALLPQKGKNPDCLIMTATPIPRTLSLTIYADLDISIIDELPKHRLPVKTLIFNEERAQDAYKIVKDLISQGKQAYIVYPIIEESINLDLKAAQAMYEQFKRNEFKDFRLSLIHGRMKQSEAEKIMSEFKDGKIDILLATSILEVGIDVANAICMVIEHAQRFGLTQLHQLRGRIGRGPEQSYCLLITSPSTPEAIARITAISKFCDGFRISEEDLKIRGPGEFFGQRQHGLTELKIANPITQIHILKKAKEEAVNLLRKDLRLESEQNLAIKQSLQKRFPEYESLMLIG